MQHSLFRSCAFYASCNALRQPGSAEHLAMHVPGFSVPFSSCRRLASPVSVRDHPVKCPQARFPIRGGSVISDSRSVCFCLVLTVSKHLPLTSRSDGLLRSTPSASGLTPQSPVMNLAMIAPPFSHAGPTKQAKFMQTCRLSMLYYPELPTQWSRFIGSITFSRETIWRLPAVLSPGSGGN